MVQTVLPETPERPFLSLYREYHQKRLVMRLPCMAGIGAKAPTIPFCSLLSK